MILEELAALTRGRVAEEKKKNGSYLGGNEPFFMETFIGKENRISAFSWIAPKQATVKNHSLFCV